MKFSKRVRLWWFGMAVAIEFGYQMGQTFLLAWQRVCPFIFEAILFLLLCLCGLLKWREWRQGFVVAVGATILIGGIGFGCVRGSANTGNVASLYGIPITASGTIGYAKPSKRQTFLIIGLHKIWTSSDTYTCQVECTWSGKVHPLDSAQLSVSAPCLLRGTLYVKQIRDKVTKRLKPELILSGKLVLDPMQKPTFFDTLRTAMNSGLVREGQLPVTTANLAESLLYGGGTVDTLTKQSFLEAGLLHTFAASGANVSIVDSSFNRVIMPVLVVFRLPGFVMQSIRMWVLWLFTGLCAFSPSITRASIMAAYRHIGQQLGREPTLLDSLLLTLLIVTIVSPDQLMSPASLLSFTATAAVFSGMNLRLVKSSSGEEAIVLKMVRRVVHVVLQAMITNVIVELALLPLTVNFFHQITPYSLISNLVIEPLLAVLLPLLLLYTCICLSFTVLPFSISMPHIVSLVPTEGINVLLMWVNLVARESHSLVTTPNVSVLWTMAYYGLFFSITWLITKRHWVSDRLCEKMHKVRTIVI